MIAYVLLSIFALCIWYSWYTSQQTVKRFTDQGVLYLGSFLSNMVGSIWRGEHMSQNLIHRYNRVKKANKKFGLEMEFGNPSFFITDLELVKLITIKNFDHFVNGRKLAPSKKNDLMGRSLLSLEGAEWRGIRSKMTPTFTSGKIKRMFPILNSSGKKLVKYFEAQVKKNNGVLNIEDGLSKFTMDFISATAFGLDTKAFENTVPSQFEEMASKIQFRLSPRLLLTLGTMLTLPKLADFLGLSVFDIKSQEFFHDMISNTIKLRNENRDVRRDDFLELMLEARDGQLRAEDDDTLNEQDAARLPLEDIDIAAQSVVFIGAGFDTVRNALQFTAYNLALNPEIQERLYQELTNAVENNGGKFSYEMINELGYLDQVISESLRLHPIAVGSNRTCTKDFEIPGTSTVIPKGAIIVIPIYSIHHDADYFPKPEVFDPERFSPDNRSKLRPNSYLPFGQGPRSCIAMRLALVELKTTIAHIVLNFVLEPSEKTQIPLKFSQSITLQAEGGIWLRFKPRE